MTEIVPEVKRKAGRPKGSLTDHNRRDMIKMMKLVKKLQAHVLDKNKQLSSSQIRAAEVLLRKVLPDLTRALIQADVNVRYVLELPPMLDKNEWLAKYGNKQLAPSVQ